MVEEFFEAVEDISPFSEETNRVMFMNDTICTHADEGLGASVDFKGLPEGAFNFKYLLKLNGLADAIDFSLYPRPCVFYGSDLRGAIIGMKM